MELLTMYFKNLQPYRLSPEWPITAEALGGELAHTHDLIDQAKE